ncbi:MAG: Tc toxin subunit A, partial [Streptosporangiaceae bacterium]
MLRDESSPNYAQLFGELRFPEENDARSVYSPAAYFVELLGLLEGTFDRPSLLERRPDLKQVVLDSANTFTETAYLDIVNEVLARLVGDEPFELLRTRTHPFGLPFTLHSERLRTYLEHLQVTPEELYRLFAGTVDPDVLAREYLALSAEDVAVVTTEAAGEADLKARYGLAAADSLADLRNVARFLTATGLTDAELHELALLADDVTLSADEKNLVGPGSAGTVPFAWYERAHRLIRLTRMTGLTLTELDLVLTSCCSARLDPAALRALAVVVRLRRAHGLTATDVCGLVVPWQPAEGVEVEVCAGDILTAANRDYRFRLANLIGVAEQDIVEIVRRYRERYSAREPSPFDRGTIGLPEISLIRRAGLLAGALGIGASELFDVLIALESDPSLQRYTTFAVLGGPGPQTRDFYRVLVGADPAAALWLAQTLFAVVTWMGDAGFDGTELADILGGRPDAGDADQLDLFAALKEQLEEVALKPELFGSGRFGERAAEVIHDVLVAHDDGIVSAVGSRLLDLDDAAVATASYTAVTDLGVILSSDFLDLGLGDRLQEKIFKNLVYRG